jgi:galactonate dehydratase
VLAASCHLSLNAPNAVIQESVRALYSGRYTQVVSNLPKVENGFNAPSEGSGLGVTFKSEIFKRPDLVIKNSKI